MKNKVLTLFFICLAFCHGLSEATNIIETHQQPPLDFIHLTKARMLSGTHMVGVSNYSSLLTSSAYYPSAAYLPSGGLVAIWRSISSSGSYYDLTILGLIYNSEGNAINGGTFQIETASVSSYGRSRPFVVTLSNGNFAIIYSFLSSSSNQEQIYGCIYSASGDLIVPIFQISSNPIVSNYQNIESVASALDNGEFITCWVVEFSYYKIYCQIVSSNGDITSDLFNADNDSLFSSERSQYPSVAFLKNGNIVVTWETAIDYSIIFGKVFSSSGSQISDLITVSVDSTFSGYNQYESYVCALDNGGFSVNWEGESSQNTSYWNIYGQVFNGQGNSVSSTYTVTNQPFLYGTSNKEVACSSIGGGQYLVVWNFDYKAAITTQVFNNNGEPVGDASFITPSSQQQMENPTVIQSVNGEHVILWGGKMQQYYNSLNTEIWGQQFNQEGLPTFWKFPASSSSSSGLSAGAIAGIVIGSLVGASLIGFGIYYLLKRIRARRKISKIESVNNCETGNNNIHPTEKTEGISPDNKGGEKFKSTLSPTNEESSRKLLSTNPGNSIENLRPMSVENATTLPEKIISPIKDGPLIKRNQNISQLKLQSRTKGLSHKSIKMSIVKIDYRLEEYCLYSILKPNDLKKTQKLYNFPLLFPLWKAEYAEIPNN